MEVSFLSQSDVPLKQILVDAMSWTDFSRRNYKQAAFPKGLSEFYKKRTGKSVTQRMMVDLYSNMVRLRGGGLFGGFGYRFRLINKEGTIVTDILRTA